MHFKRKFNILFSLIKEYFVQTKLIRLIFIIIIKKTNGAVRTDATIVIAITSVMILAFTFIVAWFFLSLVVLLLFILEYTSC